MVSTPIGILLIIFTEATLPKMPCPDFPVFIHVPSSIQIDPVSEKNVFQHYHIMFSCRYRRYIIRTKAGQTYMGFLLTYCMLRPTQPLTLRGIGNKW